MPKLSFFDCHASVGRVGYPHLLDIPDAPGLLGEMAVAGIDEALVYHMVARFGDPPTGNRLVLDEVRDHPELHPVWVLLPHHTGEMPHPEVLLRDMRAAGVKAARLFPGRANHGLSLAAWCVGNLLDALAASRVPLLLDAEAVSWEEVHDLLDKHAGLPVVMTNCSYRHNRYLYPLFERYPALRVEMSRYLGAGAVEDVVRRFGSRPLLFGTNMPQYTGTAAVAVVAYADISPEDKAAIAGGNLRRLLAEAGS